MRRQVNVWNVAKSTGPFSGEWPRVVLVHSFYSRGRPSGENETVLRQFRMLNDAGVDVSLLSVSTDDMKSIDPIYELRTAKRVTLGQGLSPVPKLREIKPDVVHVHNLFPNIASDWISGSEFPVVATLHNYRAFCASGILSRNGKDCELCPAESHLRALQYGCYRNSRVATLPITLSKLLTPSQAAPILAAQRLLAPSDLVAQTFERLAQVPVTTVYQPTEDRSRGNVSTSGAHFLFIGRLTYEKGISRLLDIWPRTRTLHVVGQGPLESELRAKATHRRLAVSFLGRVDADSLRVQLASAQAVVVPSLWREAAPAVYAEALSAGTPVISSDGTAVADQIRSHMTGAVWDWCEASLESAIVRIVNGGSRLRQTAYGVYADLFSETRWLKQIQTIYQDVARL